MEIRPIVSALLRSKTGAILIAAQVALTLAIVCNALYVVEARLATAARPSGIDDEARVAQILYVGAHQIDDPRAVQQRDLETLRAIPGVESVAPTNQVPMSTSGWNMALSLDPSKPAESIGAAAYFGDEHLVRTFGLRIVAGRDFTAADVREADSRTTRVLATDSVILSRALAERIYPGKAAVGQTLYFGDGADAVPMRVVGVVELLTTPWGQRKRHDEAFILPLRYLSDAASYALRVEPGQMARVLTEAERALSALRTDRVKIHNRSLAEIRERRYRGERAGAAILIAVSVGLLLVTASGIVGIASLWVIQRRKQIGVRRALGARRLDIVRYFLIENFLLTTVGVALGIGLAIGLNHLLVGKLELNRLPLHYLGAGALSMWGLGLTAVIGPAWRAASVPPAIATRSA